MKKIVYLTSLILTIIIATNESMGSNPEQEQKDAESMTLESGRSYAPISYVPGSAASQKSHDRKVLEGIRNGTVPLEAIFGMVGLSGYSVPAEPAPIPQKPPVKPEEDEGMRAALELQHEETREARSAFLARFEGNGQTRKLTADSSQKSKHLPKKVDPAATAPHPGIKRKREEDGENPAPKKAKIEESEVSAAPLVDPAATTAPIFPDLTMMITETDLKKLKKAASEQLRLASAPQCYYQSGWVRWSVSQVKQTPTIDLILLEFATKKAQGIDECLNITPYANLPDLARKFIQALICFKSLERLIARDYHSDYKYITDRAELIQRIYFANEIRFHYKTGDELAQMQATHYTIALFATMELVDFVTESRQEAENYRQNGATFQSVMDLMVKFMQDSYFFNPDIWPEL